MAAPTYTQVWGPKVGCDDIGMKSTQTFMLATLNETQVTEICKDTCMSTLTEPFQLMKILTRDQKNQIACF
jgi:hypothetical protein